MSFYYIEMTVALKMSVQLVGSMLYSKSSSARLRRANTAPRMRVFGGASAGNLKGILDGGSAPRGACERLETKNDECS